MCIPEKLCAVVAAADDAADSVAALEVDSTPVKYNEQESQMILVHKNNLYRNS